MARIRSQVMVGRDDDLRALLEAAEQARQGAPALALVTGEAGIGKSRLVRELAERLEDALVLVGNGVDLRTGEIPFGVLADTLADLLRQRGETALSTDEHALLGPLLPGALPAAPADPARLLSGAVALFDRLATGALTCWIVEDLQWTDTATRDLVSVLARRQAGQLLIVATVRTVGSPERRTDLGFASYVDDLVRLPVTRTVDLHRLSVQDVQRQLAELLTEPLPTSVVQQIVEVGDGVPFVVEELAAARGRPELSSAAAVAEARLGALSGSARRLVEAASLGDGHLRWPLLEAVVDLAPEELDEAFLEAVRTGILEENSDRSSCRFRHALLRDAADRAIPPAARRGWHRRWAEAIAARPGVVPTDLALLAVAEHWDQANDEAQAALAAVEAMPAARRTGAGPEELALWRRLLDLWPKASTALLEAGTTHHRIVGSILRLALGLGGDRETIQLLDRLEQEALDDLEREAVRLRRITAAGAKTFTGIVPPEQRAHWEPLFRSALPDPLARDALAILGHFCTIEDRSGDAVIAETEALAAGEGDAASVLTSRMRMCWRLQARGETEAEIDLLERAISDPGGVTVFELWTVEGNLIWALAQSGRHEAAELAIARALARVPDPISVGVGFEHIVENAAFHWICTGQWDRAEDLIVAAQPYWGRGRRSSDVRLAEIEILRTGRLADIDAWRAAIDEPPVPMGAGPRWIAETVAWHVAREGDLAEMRRLLADTWAGADRAASDELWTVVLAALRWEVDSAARRPDPADRPAADEHLATMLDVAAMLHRFEATGAAWDAEVTAQIARFRGEPSRDLFAWAVERWEAVDHPYDAAVARLCLAEAALAEGDRDSGRREAEAVLGVARALGAGPLATAAEELIARHRLVSRVGDVAGKPGSLTAREREVLGLLAEGRTNEQIATELYMSPKTASVHVSRIIAKLGAANRTEAAAVARRIGLL